jgi:predicted ester cyclase
VADYSPAFVSRGQQHVREAVERAHATFAGFREEIKTIVAADDHVVVHFTITGTHTGPWGPVLATGRPVAFDEIVIMTVRDSKVVHQTGVIDNVTGLRQVGVLPAART